MTGKLAALQPCSRFPNMDLIVADVPPRAARGQHLAVRRESYRRDPQFGLFAETREEPPVAGLPQTNRRPPTGQNLAGAGVGQVDEDVVNRATKTMQLAARGYVPDADQTVQMTAGQGFAVRGKGDVGKFWRRSAQGVYFGRC